jgi:hypothetical protein
MDAAVSSLAIDRYTPDPDPVPVKWLNPTGYTDPPAGSIQRFLFITVPLVDYNLDPVHPLSLLMSDGSIIQSERHRISDKATAPWLTSWWIPRDLFPRASYYHDSGCGNGGHWTCRQVPLSVSAQIRAGEPVDLPRELFTFEATTRDAQDRILFYASQLDGVTEPRARAVYAGVSLGALVGIGRQDRDRS